MIWSSEVVGGCEEGMEKGIDVWTAGDIDGDGD
jgi:hypothetical protein